MGVPTMTPEEIAAYNRAYIEDNMQYYGDGMTYGEEEDLEPSPTPIDSIEPPSPAPKESSQRAWMMYSVNEEPIYTCRNCPRRAATGRCPLTYAERTSCTEGLYHRHPGYKKTNIRIMEKMPS